MGLFLNEVNFKTTRSDEFPFNLPIFKSDFTLKFSAPITFVLGENGVGKSTFLENLAYKLGFNILGGNKNHTFNISKSFDNVKLSDYLKMSYKIKPTSGFFFRAESFFNFAGYIDELAEEDKCIYRSYGGKSLQKQSHGESFLSLFQSRFKNGLYILDEPEAALSPERQFALISLLKQKTQTNECQFIIATHSPILIATPNSIIYEITNNGNFEMVDYINTKQFQLYKSFINNPERIIKML